MEVTMRSKLLVAILTSVLFVLAWPAAAQVSSSLPKELSTESKACVACHSSTTTGIYQQWGDSKHFRANVGCYECHGKKKDAPGAFEHNGFTISVIVSPNDCGSCHGKEATEFLSSHHGKADRIIGSADNLLGEVVEGNTASLVTEQFPKGISAAVVNGCWQCHGGVTHINKDGKLDAATWPNTGMGRVNPDGSEGSCTACHQRHEFSVAQAREPKTCGKCHQGPDHPQYEIYDLSKHGIMYTHTAEKDMRLDSSKWIVGEDYTAAPTCATCHMSATKTQPVTHDVGLRIKWNNRPAVSVLANEADKQMGLPGANVLGDQRQANMKDVCSACHNVNFVDNFYKQYEAELTLYNEKFGKPGVKLYGQATAVLKALEDSSYAQYAHKIDWTWFEIWHHQGRRARHGASMMAPDYTQWHGNYEIARDFYTEFVPQLKEIIAQGKASSKPEAKTAADTLQATLTEVLSSADHKWFTGNEDAAVKAERLKRVNEFEQRYK
jgi:nitrate/TMAO reductase-like tetraheme cytochrome c subunit